MLTARPPHRPAPDGQRTGRLMAPPKKEWIRPSSSTPALKPADGGRTACVEGTRADRSGSPAIVRIEVMARPGAVGRLRRTACILIAACAAAMLTAASASAAPRHGAVLAATAGAGQTAAAAQTVTSGPAQSLAQPAAARDTAISAAAAASSGPPAPPHSPASTRGGQVGATRSRSASGPIDIAAGVLIICFAVFAVLAVRRRGGLARHPDLPPHPPLEQRYGGAASRGYGDQRCRDDCQDRRGGPVWKMSPTDFARTLVSSASRSCARSWPSNSAMAQRRRDGVQLP